MGSLGQSLPLALILSLFVLIVKPLIVILLMSWIGYRKKTAFLTSLTVGQISEFSLIFLMMGVKNGQISNEIISVFTIVALISIAGSTYMLLYANKIYPLLSNFLSFFERAETKKEKSKSEEYQVVLFGCNRIGQDFLESFKELGNKFLVVDFNPEIIAQLTALGLNCRYGDADDNEFLDELELEKAKMIISTIPDYDTNEFLVGKIKQLNPETITIVISHNVEDAIGLYDSGATYVITPHLLGGKFASMLITKYGFNLEKFIQEREKHLKDLGKHRELGASESYL